MVIVARQHVQQSMKYICAGGQKWIVKVLDIYEGEHVACGSLSCQKMHTILHEVVLTDNAMLFISFIHLLSVGVSLFLRLRGDAIRI